jgi:hypothetical protein
LNNLKRSLNRAERTPVFALKYILTVDNIDLKWFNFNGHPAKSNYTESEVLNEQETKTSKLH